MVSVEWEISGMIFWCIWGVRGRIGRALVVLVSRWWLAWEERKAWRKNEWAGDEELDRTRAGWERKIVMVGVEYETGQMRMNVKFGASNKNGCGLLQSLWLWWLVCNVRLACWQRLLLRKWGEGWPGDNWERELLTNGVAVKMSKVRLKKNVGVRKMVSKGLAACAKWCKSSFGLREARKCLGWMSVWAR